MEEKIHHPKHYNEHPSGIECIDVVEHMSFNIGNAIKYLWRTGLKPNEPNTDELKKAIWYIERALGMHKDSRFYQPLSK